jgi:hypothetical protein
MTPLPQKYPIFTNSPKITVHTFGCIMDSFLSIARQSDSEFGSYTVVLFVLEKLNLDNHGTSPLLV